MIIFDGECRLCSVNKRFNRNFSLTNEYRDFKTILIASFCKHHIEPNEKFIVRIKLLTHFDIDAPIKAILDSIQEAYGINDRDCNGLFVTKQECKRTIPNRLTIDLEGIYDTINRPKKCIKHKGQGKASGCKSNKRRRLRRRV